MNAFGLFFGGILNFEVKFSRGKEYHSEKRDLYVYGCTKSLDRVTSLSKGGKESKKILVSVQHVLSLFLCSTKQFSFYLPFFLHSG